MGKEIKIGLAALTVLFVVLGYVAYKRFAKNDGEPLARLAVDDPPKASPKKTVLSGGPVATPAAKKSSRPTSPATADASDQSWRSSDSVDTGTRFSMPNQRPSGDTHTHLDSEEADHFAGGEDGSSVFSSGSDRYGAAGERDMAAHAREHYESEQAAAEPPVTDPFRSNHAQDGTIDQTARGAQPGRLEPANDVHLAPNPSNIYQDGRDAYGESDVQPSAAHELRTAQNQSRRTMSPYGQYRSPADSSSRPGSGPYRTADDPQPPSSRATATVAPYSNPNAYRKMQQTPNTTGLSRGTPFNRRESYNQTNQSPAVVSSRLENFQRPGDSHVVRPGESFWSISKLHYGTGAYFKALAQHNHREFPRPELMRAGDVVSTPAAHLLEQTFPDLCPKTSRQPTASTSRTHSTVATRNVGGHHHRIYTVEEGDTLFDIARYELGSAVRWVDIHQLNREALGNDVDFLKPGTQLILPTAPSDRVTQEPPSSAPRRTYRR